MARRPLATAYWVISRSETPPAPAGPAYRYPPPQLFPNPEAAWWWAIGRGAYPADEQVVRNAYESIKSTRNPTNAIEMAIHWFKHVTDIAR